MKGKFTKRLFALLAAAALISGTAAVSGIHNAGGGQAAATDSQLQAQDNDSGVEVHFIDVGQGDASLIKCGGHAMLIDAGGNDKGTALQLYLKKQGVEKLDYLILTHPDSDHIGGADVIITKFEIGQVLMSDYEKDNRIFQEMTQALKNKNLTATTPEPGSVYSLGSAQFTVLGPNTGYSDPNNSSVVILFEDGENSFLFTGDAEEKAERDILKAGFSVRADVYQAGHHGSDTASSEEFLEEVNPDYAVISCGEGNSYGHPHAAVLNRLRAMGVKLFRTDEQGSVVAQSDGKEITWNCAPSETWQAGERTGASADAARSNAEKTGAGAVQGGETGASTGIDQSNAEKTGAGAVQSKETETDVTQSSVKESDADVTQDGETEAVEGEYIGNKNNGKLHRASCSKLPGEKNRVAFETREEAVAAGYDDPCKVCNP